MIIRKDLASFRNAFHHRKQHHCHLHQQQQNIYQPTAKETANEREERSSQLTSKNFLFNRLYLHNYNPDTQSAKGKVEEEILGRCFLHPRSMLSYWPTTFFFCEEKDLVADSAVSADLACRERQVTDKLF